MSEVVAEKDRVQLQLLTTRVEHDAAIKELTAQVAAAQAQRAELEKSVSTKAVEVDKKALEVEQVAHARTAAEEAVKIAQGQLASLTAQYRDVEAKAAALESANRTLSESLRQVRLFGRLSLGVCVVFCLQLAWAKSFAVYGVSRRCGSCSR